jgi:alpha-galactosidase
MKGGHCWFCALAAVLAASCGDDSEPPPGEAPCSVSLGSATGADLTLQGSGACAADVRLALRIATGAPDAPTWTAAVESSIRVEGTWSLDGQRALRDVVLRNDGAEPVTVVGLEWATLGDTRLAADRFLHNGYQSWSYTGVERIPTTALEDALGTAPHGGEDGDVLKEHYGVSWWWTFVADAESRGLFVGADGATVLKTFIAVDRAPELRVRVVMGMTGDRIVLAPGEERALDGLVLSLGDVGDGLEAWATEVAARHGSPEPPKRALGGWGSWNLYYEDISAEAMRVEAAWAAAQLGPAGLSHFLIDDGYEPHWGAWYADPSFGAELGTLADEQAALGLSPAIWVAPFYVATSDPDFAAHPEWFVQGEDGAPRLYDNFGPTYAALEVTVPAARDKVVSQLVALSDAGYSTLKIDFLFGGALEGARDPALTSLEAYALWMRTLREALPEVHLVGCGAPILPSVGWVDSMRVGPDIAFTLLPEPQWDFIASEARHNAFRATTDAFWALDPDVVLLRGDGIDDAQAWTHVVSAAMTGGNYLLGDGRQSSARRLAMAVDPEILAMTRDRVAARPDGPASVVDDLTPPTPLLVGGRPVAIPHVWRKSSADGARSWVAVFGWETGFSGEVELPTGAEELVPPAADGERVTREGVVAGAVDVPRHGVRLFAH